MRNEVLLGPLILDGLEGTVIADDTLARITAPTLILWGTDDPMGGPDIARSFATRIPTAKLEILEGAGHAPWLDAPQFVARRIAAFLA